VRRHLLPVLLTIGLAFVASVAVSNHSPAEPPPSRTLQGTTQQGIAIRLTLDERRRVRTFAATVIMACRRGRTESAGWYPSDGGAPAVFGSRGPQFEASELRHQPSGEVLGGTIRGTILRRGARGTLEMSREVRGREECTSGLVSWTAR